MFYHVPALLEESIKGLNIRPGGIYVDATFGGGGHSMEILNRLSGGKLIAFDQDEDAMRNIPRDKRLIFLNQNFRFLANNLKFNGIEQIDGLIADLGVSFHQFDEPERGFTFRQDVSLDMRMNKKGSVTAASLLKNLSEAELAKLFYDYGELINSRRVAKEIVAARALKPLTTVNDMISAIGKLAPFKQEHKFYARVFQALRIAVNQEMECLREMLEQALSVLRKDGRLVVITYHSLEDRMVKNFMRTGNFDGIENKDFYGNLITPFRLINKKGIVPDESEIEDNKRARSARLRIAEKI
ncbi:MAG TPA: 16S rRNA (cytosine(1402)-N(4))-methyltransferase RsmH [Bacteroidales bacterium]|jgi:16S rRNA (cytosine1402-N4)-methyltransferase|nr:16S rRNA (cytosine(1402)-N(4))-methyltransferase RsmH [Bacteroidales bacterium]MDI9552448.1 16S rRNA (cytosine(1402)-N(4))-methyltransferase RsmH [Bacteroidota bacterium]MBP7037325.1 16S rRNA (cytosine(1402)-N(4))-methyltransferase RsmH [Bacteroidales bacterium]MZP65871.1 16S rRNA (cytosine(1402)-N(4))-methyltransferase RsmH [Bacteroidales bacterium]NLK55709.1 16S rRNA (cytosine(1402)-N(4))-methyltransferase RsmH [Bacteroidales bacterium]